MPLERELRRALGGKSAVTIPWPAAAGQRPDQAESSRFTTRCMGQSRQHLVEPAITLGRHIGALVTGEVTAGDSGDLAWILWMGRVRPRRWSSPGTRARQRAAAAMHYDLPAQGCSVAARSDTPLLTVAHQRQGTP